MYSRVEFLTGRAISYGHGDKESTAHDFHLAVYINIQVKQAYDSISSKADEKQFIPNIPHLHRV